MDIHAVLLRRFWPVLFHLSVVLKYGLMVLLGCNIQSNPCFRKDFFFHLKEL